MEHTGSHKHLQVVILLTTLLFLAGRVGGPSLLKDTWSLVHWQHLPSAYVAGWAVGALLIVVALGRFLPAIAAFFESRRNSLIAGTVLLGMFWIFQYDSFLYGGGNLEVARIAQDETVIFPWYEFGSTVAAWLFHSLWLLFDLHYNTAGVYAWKTLALACTVLTLIGAYKTVRLMSEDPTRRFGLFLILFFGPQALLYFGFVGSAPVIVAATAWMVYGIVRTLSTRRSRDVGMLWGTLALALFLQISTIYLLPAAVATTMTVISGPRKRALLVSALGGLLALAAVTTGVYVMANSNLHLQAQILLPDGKPPHGDYSLFSFRHLLDIAQAWFLLFPLLIVVVITIMRRPRGVLGDPLAVSSGIMVLSGLVAATLIDPVNSIVLDLPRFAAYLAPGAFMLTAVVGERRPDKGASPAAIGVLGALSVVLPLSILPAYIDIHRAEPYTTAYLNHHTAYYRTAAVSFRDAYFYRKDMDEANRWDQSYVRRSPDHLNLRGIEEFAIGGRLDVALPSLNKLIARNPYWAEPRALFAKLMMEKGEFALARPQLDTALMLEPYNSVHLINLYSFYRDQGQYADALAIVRRALDQFPGSTDIKVDLMIIEYRAGNSAQADVLAEELLQRDSTQAYPYVVKGFLAETRGDLEEARRCFERFANLAPDAPEASQMRKRANDIYLQLHGRTNQ